MNPKLPPVIDEILLAFESKGQERYAQEDINQMEHALQAAALAQSHYAAPTLVCAALLHDIGHILNENQMPQQLKDDLHDHHEEKGYQFLRNHFGDAVAEPVRLHVAAKRYLCTTDPNYELQLSPTSLKSYQDQGGRMTPQEQRLFEQNPFYRESLDLRRWDDEAKVTGKSVPPLATYLPLLESCLLNSNQTH